MTLLVILPYYVIRTTLFGNHTGPLSGESGTLKFNLLYEKLFSVNPKWKIVGVNLGFMPSTLDAIQVKHGSDSKMCLAAVLEEWLKIKPEATWGDVTKMLESRSLEENRLAEEIKKN